MKSFILVLVLVALAHGYPQKGRQRAGKQLDTKYGAPEQADASAPAQYGAPEQAEESAPAPAVYGVPEQADESAPAVYGSPLGDAESRADDTQASYAGGAEDGLQSEASELDAAQEARDGAGSGDPIAMLKDSIPGTPGEDYPIYADAPETAFTCDGRVNGGYYADPEAQCQAFHICTDDAQGGLTKYSFLCPNGTIFNQEYFICDWWFNVDCSKAEDLASSRNADLASARSEADARIAAEAGNALDAAASGVSESVANYGAPKQADEALTNYGSQDAGLAEASEEAPISTYGSK